MRLSRRFLMTLASSGVSPGDDGTLAACGVTGLGVSSFRSPAFEAEWLPELDFAGITTPNEALRFF